jgi:hypothetical protein
VAVERGRTQVGVFPILDVRHGDDHFVIIHPHQGDALGGAADGRDLFGGDPDHLAGGAHHHH